MDFVPHFRVFSLALVSIASFCVSAELTSFRVDAASPEVTVLVGDKTASPQDAQTSQLDHPFGVGFDPDGRMLVAEYKGGRVLRQLISGELQVIAGLGRAGYSGDGGAATQATFHDIHNLAVTPEGDIFLSDHENHVVRRIDATTGKISTFAGTGEKGFGGDGGSATEAKFNQVMCVTLTPDNSKLLVTDLRNRRIRSIDLRTNIITTIAGNGEKGVPQDGQQATDAPLIDPRASAMDHEGNLYVLERGGNALRVVWPTGKIETVAGTGRKGNQDGPAIQAQLAGPKHLAFDAAGNVYIADDLNHAIRKYDPHTRTVSTILGDGEFKLNRPHGVTVRGDDLYIADSWNHRVLKMSIHQGESLRIRP